METNHSILFAKFMHIILVIRIVNLLLYFVNTGNVNILEESGYFTLILHVLIGIKIYMEKLVSVFSVASFFSDLWFIKLYRGFANHI